MEQISFSDLAIQYSISHKNCIEKKFSMQIEFPNQPSKLISQTITKVTTSLLNKTCRIISTVSITVTYQLTYPTDRRLTNQQLFQLQYEHNYIEYQRRPLPLKSSLGRFF